MASFDTFNKSLEKEEEKVQAVTGAVAKLNLVRTESDALDEIQTKEFYNTFL